MGLIDVVQDPSKFNWVGIPYRQRYAERTPPAWLVTRMRDELHDDLLDLKFYMPTLKWHVIRYIGDNRSNNWTRVWECKDDPNLGTFETLGDWIIGALKRGDTWNENKDFLENIEKCEDLKEKSDRATMEDIGLAMGEDIRKPVIKLFDYGSDQPMEKSLWQNPGLPSANYAAPSAELSDTKKTS